MKPKKATAPSDSQRDSQDWKERFQKEFGSRYNLDWPEILDFIQQEKDQSYQKGFNEAVESLNKILKEKYG